MDAEVRGIQPGLWPSDYCQEFVKEPIEVLDYFVDFTDQLGTGETLASSSVTATAGLTVGTDWIDGNRVYVWLSGGTLAETYTVTVNAVTGLSQTLVGEFVVKVDYR